MENTTHESQYANAEISCTADEQLCRDAEFNLLMQAGTIVRMERFNVEELRGVLEQLVADGSVLPHRAGVFDDGPRDASPDSGCFRL